MDRKRFELAAQENAALQKAELQRRQAENLAHMNKRSSLEKKVAQFSEIAEAYSGTMDRFDAFAAKGIDLFYLAPLVKNTGQERQGATVIVGDAPTTYATPHHVVACVASQNNSPHSPFKDKEPIFQFVFLPKNRIKSATRMDIKGQHPIEGLPGVIPIDIEKFDSVDAVEQDILTVSGRNFIARARHHKKIESELAQFQSTVDMVLEAAANPELNPHLQPLFEEAAS